MRAMLTKKMQFEEEKFKIRCSWTQLYFIEGLIEFMKGSIARKNNFEVKDQNEKRAWIEGLQLNQIKGQIEEIRSLLINWGSNCINSRPRTNVEKAANFRADNWIWQGYNWIDFYNQNCNWGLDWTNHKLRTNVNSDTFLPPFPFKWNGAFFPKRHRFMHCSCKQKRPKWCHFERHCGSSSSSGHAR